jgi:hypothetical protein
MKIGVTLLSHTYRRSMDAVFQVKGINFSIFSTDVPRFLAI